MVFPEPVSPREWVKSGYSLHCVPTGNGPFAQLDGIQPTDLDAKKNIRTTVTAGVALKTTGFLLKTEQYDITEPTFLTDFPFS